MACSDPSFFAFDTVPEGATYSLSVSGPSGGFTAAADFTPSGSAIQHWAPDDIAPGPKNQTLNGAHLQHNVVIFVTIVSPAAITVTVRASINGVDFCREVTGAAGTTDRITHILSMA